MTWDLTKGEGRPGKKGAGVSNKTQKKHRHQWNYDWGCYWMYQTRIYNCEKCGALKIGRKIYKPEPPRGE